MQFIMGHMQSTRLVRTGIMGVLIALVLILAVSLPVYADKQTITSVTVDKSTDKVSITIKSTAPLSMHENRLQGSIAYFDLYGSMGAKLQKRVAVNSGGIKSVNCVIYQASPPVARISVATTGLKEYSVERQNGNRTTIVHVYKNGKAPQPIAAKIVEAEPVIQAQPAPKPVLVASTKPIVQAADTRTETTQKPKAVVRTTKPALVASAKPALPKQDVPVAKAPEKLVSLDFVASDIHDVLKALAVQGGVNIVAAADVKGEVTASLNKVTVEDALKLVTNLSGYKFEQSSGSYVVGTADNLKSLNSANISNEAKATDVVAVRYANMPMISKLIEAQCTGVSVNTPEAAKEGVNGPTFVVLTGPASQVQAAKSMIASVDSSYAENAARMVTQYYQVKFADINELATLLVSTVPGLSVNVGPNQGFELKAPRALEMGSDSAAADTESKAQKSPPKTLVLQGSQQEIDQALAFLQQVDVQQPQILIEARVLDITDDAAKDLGIKWHDSDGSLTSFGFLENHNDVLVRPGETVTPSGSIPIRGPALTLGRYFKTPMDFFGLVKALEDTGKAKVLASPNVMAMEGKPATIFIGDEFSYVIRVEQTTTGVNVQTETAKVGVQLLTIATVSGDYITMDLHPEVSVITRFIDTAGGLSLPLIARRFVDSTIRVKDGETIAIGGLIREEEIDRMSGIPLLRNLPFIGGLFRTKSTTRSKSEVMMFITPRIVRDEAAT